MSKLVLLGIIFVLLSSVGCMPTYTPPPPSPYSVGNDFSVENVKKIAKGETTNDTLSRMFGEPFMKTVMSETEEKWIYTYTSGTVTMRGSGSSIKMENKGYQKTLDLLLKNGIVTNFAYTNRNI